MITCDGELISPTEPLHRCGQPAAKRLRVSACPCGQQDTTPDDRGGLCLACIQLLARSLNHAGWEVRRHCHRCHLTRTALLMLVPLPTPHDSSPPGAHDPTTVDQRPTELLYSDTRALVNAWLNSDQPAILRVLQNMSHAELAATTRLLLGLATSTWRNLAAHEGFSLDSLLEGIFTP